MQSSDGKSSRMAALFAFGIHDLIWDLASSRISSSISAGLAAGSIGQAFELTELWSKMLPQNYAALLVETSHERPVSC